MEAELYKIPENRLSNEEIFPLELYEKPGCLDLVEHVKWAISDKKHHVVPEKKNPIFDTDLILPISNEFMDLLGSYDVFKRMADQGYGFRENPRIVTWNYTGPEKRGAAQNYHHDGWDIGGQVSTMLMLESNQNATHMRLVENTRDGFFHKAYTKILRFRHYNKFLPNAIRKIVSSVLLRMINISLDMRSYKKLAGDKGTLFVFNTDQMHKAHAVKGTSRSMVHCNFVIDEAEKRTLIKSKNFNASNLGDTGKKLCARTNNLRN